MTDEEYIRSEEKIKNKYEISIHKLRETFVKENSDFKIGDFIYNVTGIIKISRIEYNINKWSDTPEILYYGLRYKKINGELLRTKDKKISSLSHNLKKVKL